MNEFITLQTYKDYKNLTKTDNDVKLGVIVNAVNSLIKAYLGRTVILDENTPFEEYFSLDYETDVIFPKFWPIADIVSITEIPAGYSYDSTVHFALEVDEEYMLDGEDRIYKIGSCWAQGPRTIRLEYTAGYATLPDDIKLAAIELVDYFFKEQYLQARTTGNTTITNLVPNETTMPPHVKLILDNYKNG